MVKRLQSYSLYRQMLDAFGWSENKEDKKQGRENKSDFG